VKPQTTSPVSLDVAREADRHGQAATNSRPGTAAPAAGTQRKYNVDELFGVYPHHYFSKH
jgi:hypothetical protein